MFGLKEVDEKGNTVKNENKPKRKRQAKSSKNVESTADQQEPILKEKGKIIDINKAAEENKNLNRASVLDKGVPKEKELIAPPSFKLGQEEELKVGNKFVRSFYLQGYPKAINIEWMDYIYNSDQDVDVSMYIEPINTGSAIDDIQKKITAKQTKLIIDRNRGEEANATKLQSEIDNLTNQKIKLEQTVEKLFATQVFFNLYSNSKKEMEHSSRDFDDFFNGRGAHIEPLYMRQDKAYKSATPYGKSYIQDEMRNVNTGQLTAMFPFYNAEINHIRGVKLGVNSITGNDISVDFYNRDIMLNSNINVFGTSGSGKTFLISLLTLRSVLRDIKTVIIDPEDEFYEVTHAVGGVTFNISQNSKQIPNPFDIEEEESFNNQTNKIEKTLSVNNKVSDLINLIYVMYPHMSDLQASLTMNVLKKMYNTLGIEENKPYTLYKESDNVYDSKTKTIQLSKVKKDMPTFSFFWSLLNSELSSHPELKEEVAVLKRYTKDEAYGMFDTLTPEELKRFENAPVVNFNVNQLEESVLRPIGMFITLQWAWEKFGKKQYNQKKRVLIDEGWMLLSPNYEGSQYTGKMLETMSRRFRKLNGGLLIASQGIDEFIDTQSGRAILQNAFTTIFCKQNPNNYEKVASYFKLSQGEGNVLRNATKGMFLIKFNGTSAYGFAESNKFEKDAIEKSKARSVEKHT